MDREAIAVTAGDVYLLKWFDDRDRTDPAVRYELANRRETAVSVRIEEVLPAGVTSDDVDLQAAFDSEWSFDQGTVTYEGTIPVGETLVTGFSISPDSVGSLDVLLVPPAITDRDSGERLLSEGSSFRDVVLKVPEDRPDPIQPAIEELVDAMERRTDAETASDEADTSGIDAGEDELIESLIERRVNDPLDGSGIDDTESDTSPSTDDGESPTADSDTEPTTDEGSTAEGDPTTDDDAIAEDDLTEAKPTGDTSEQSVDDADERTDAATDDRSDPNDPESGSGSDPLAEPTAHPEPTAVVPETEPVDEEESADADEAEASDDTDESTDTADEQRRVGDAESTRRPDEEIAPANTGASEKPSNPFVDDPSPRPDREQRADSRSSSDQDFPGEADDSESKVNSTPSERDLTEGAAETIDSERKMESAASTADDADSDGSPSETDDDSDATLADADAASVDDGGRSTGESDGDTFEQAKTSTPATELVESDVDFGRPHRASGSRVDDVIGLDVEVADEFDRSELVDDFQYTEVTVAGVDPRDVARGLTTDVEKIVADGRSKYDVLDGENALQIESHPVGTRTGTVEGSAVAVGSWMAVGSETVDYGRGGSARAGVLAALGLACLSAGGLLATDGSVAASVASSASVAVDTVGTVGGGALAVLGLLLLGAGIVSYRRHPRGDVDRTYYYREVHRMKFDGPVSERVIQRDESTLTDLYGDLSVSVGTAIQVVVDEADEQTVRSASALPTDIRSSLSTDHELVVDGIE